MEDSDVNELSEARECVESRLERIFTDVEGVVQHLLELRGAITCEPYGVTGKEDITTMSLAKHLQTLPLRTAEQCEKAHELINEIRGLLS